MPIGEIIEELALSLELEFEGHPSVVRAFDWLNERNNDNPNEIYRDLMVLCQKLKR